MNKTLSLASMYRDKRKPGSHSLEGPGKLQGCPADLHVSTLQRLVIACLYVWRI
jgi:hypothetical protein